MNGNLLYVIAGMGGALLVPSCRGNQLNGNVKVSNPSIRTVFSVPDRRGHGLNGTPTKGGGYEGTEKKGDRPSPPPSSPFRPPSFPASVLLLIEYGKGRIGKENVV